MWNSRALIQIILILLSFSIAKIKCQYGPPSKPSGGGGAPAPSYDAPTGGGGGGGSPDSGPSGGGEGGEAKPEPFSFMYEVKDAATGTDFSHMQESDGKKVKGKYEVLLPDGRNQIVTYTADEMGYNADVKYDGEAQPGPPGPTGGGAPPSGMPKPGAPPGGGPPMAPKSKSNPGGGVSPFAGYPPAGGPPKPAGPPSAGGGTPPSNAYLPPSGFGGAGY